MIRGSRGARTPVDVWLRRQMKIEHDACLGEGLPAEWTEMVDRIADRFGETR